MSGNKHFRRALVSGLVISALLIGLGFWQSITMGIVCLVSCGALLAIFCLYTRNQTREIRRLSDYLTTLVNGTAVLHKEPVELAAVVEQALAPFIIQAELRQMTLAVDCRQGQFLGDRLWTVEAVQNIVKNCLEHMDNGGTLRLTGTQTALYCQLVIADDGCGIEKEDLPHIFERFYKGKNAGADSVGIGLALSKSVLNRENATVEVQSTVGVGTTFTIRFYRNII